MVLVVCAPNLGSEVVVLGRKRGQSILREQREREVG